MNIHQFYDLFATIHALDQHKTDDCPLQYDEYVSSPVRCFGLSSTLVCYEDSESWKHRGKNIDNPLSICSIHRDLKLAARQAQVVFHPSPFDNGNFNAIPVLLKSIIATPFNSKFQRGPNIDRSRAKQARSIPFLRDEPSS